MRAIILIPLKNGHHYRLRRSCGFPQKSPLIGALSRFFKNPSSEETYCHGTCTASMPARRRPRLVRPSRQPRGIPAFDWQRVPHPNRSRPNGRLPSVGRLERSPHNRREVSSRKNYYISYDNIHRACFRMLDANVSAQFKVSNNPSLTGWNATMSVLAILNQLQNTYGKPDMMTIFTNESLFRSPMGPSDSPEVLFYRIEFTATARAPNSCRV